MAVNGIDPDDSLLVRLRGHAVEASEGVIKNGVVRLTIPLDSIRAVVPMDAWGQVADPSWKTLSLYELIHKGFSPIDVVNFPSLLNTDVVVAYPCS